MLCMLHLTFTGRKQSADFAGRKLGLVVEPKQALIIALELNLGLAHPEIH